SVFWTLRGGNMNKEKEGETRGNIFLQVGFPGSRAQTVLFSLIMSASIPDVQSVGVCVVSGVRGCGFCGWVPGGVCVSVFVSVCLFNLCVHVRVCVCERERE